MSRVGILTFSDGRDFLHQGITSPEEDIWDLENSGQQATWFAGRSDSPAENCSKGHLDPEEWYFPLGSAAVHCLATPGEGTLAYLSRLDGVYRMQVTKGRFDVYDDEKTETLMHQSTHMWPTRSPGWMPQRRRSFPGSERTTFMRSLVT